jgi:hypothetical protein
LLVKFDDPNQADEANNPGNSTCFGSNARATPRPR